MRLTDPFSNLRNWVFRIFIATISVPCGPTNHLYSKELNFIDPISNDPISKSNTIDANKIDANKSEANSVLKKIKIMIDPGHGGTDNGAVYGGTREADLTLSVSQKLQKILLKESHYDVQMTRTTDKTLSLQERLNFEKQSWDLFISIHANATKDGKAKGLEFYFQNQLPPDEDSKYLASVENQILEQTQQNNPQELNPNKKAEIMAIVEDLKRQNRIRESQKLSMSIAQQWTNDTLKSNLIKQAPFYVISQNSSPSVLIEMGFLSHPNERKKLLSESYQQELAQKIYTGIQNYLIKNSAASVMK